MNTDIFKKEICSYCRLNQSCSKDKMKYIEINKVVYKNEYSRKIMDEYILENSIKSLKCKNYCRN